MYETTCVCAYVGGVAAYLDGSFVERDFGISPHFYAETGEQLPNTVVTAKICHHCA